MDVRFSPAERRGAVKTLGPRLGMSRSKNLTYAFSPRLQPDSDPSPFPSYELDQDGRKTHFSPQQPRLGSSESGMKQVLQSLSNGRTQVVDVPCPQVKPGHVLIRSRVSLISAGTERMLLDFGKAGWLNKARQQPDKVRMVLDKIKTDGLVSTVDAVRAQLNEPAAMGYCNVGTVLEAGAGVTQFTNGDSVVSNGPHAEIVCVSTNLCAKIPEGVNDESAAFTVLGAVALQGIRLAEPTLGESIAVFGLGLVGLLTVQLLRAHGCRVLGLDFDRDRLRLARRLGAETVDLGSEDEPLVAATKFSRGRGLDAVLIAAATTSNEPVHQAAQMCRKRGRIVLVGVAGLQLSRQDFYEKELSFRVSCSYGPGRYDPDYEERGHDYPLGFVRWTQQRNFEAVLDTLAAGQVDAAPLISHRFACAQATQAYELIGGGDSSLGVLLTYPDSDRALIGAALARTIRHPVAVPVVADSNSAPRVGFIGAGHFARRVLIPAFKRCGAKLQVVATASGLSACHAARQFDFAQSTTDPESVLHNDDVDAVVVATRHDSHAQFVCQALEAGKHVFVEKPLALNHDELDRIVRTFESHGQSAGGFAQKRGQSPSMLEGSIQGPDSVGGQSPFLGKALLGSSLLMVGFNRRFSPHAQKIAALLNEFAEPKTFIMTVNAGAIPDDHWLHDPRLGGGRIIGEGCHFIDLVRFLCGHAVASVQATNCVSTTGTADQAGQVSLTLGFADGSIGSVHYLANGHRAFPKERLDVFCAGRILQLDNFRKLRGYGWKHFKKMNLWRQDKGHNAEVRAFLEAVKNGGSCPMDLDELVEVTRVSFDAVEAAKSFQTIRYSQSSKRSVAPASAHAAIDRDVQARSA